MEGLRAVVIYRHEGKVECHSTHGRVVTISFSSAVFPMVINHIRLRVLPSDIYWVQ